MNKLLKYFKPYIWLILCLVILTYLQVITNLKLPDYMARIINQGIVASNNDAIIDNGIWMLVFTLISAILAVGTGFIASKVATEFSRDIRKKLFTKVESFSLNEFNKFSTASLITRSTNDIQQVQTVTLMTFRLVLMAPIMAIAALQKALNVAPSMSWIIGSAAGGMLVMIAFLFIIGLPKFQALQKLVDRLNLVTRENLTGLRVIRAFNNEAKETERFEKVNRDLTDMNLFVNRLMVIVQPIMMFIMSITTVAIVWFGAHLIDSGSLQIGDMMAFMQYALQVIMSFLLLSVVFIMFPRASVSAKRIAEVLETNSSIQEPERPKPIDPNSKGILEFKDVTFSYPGADLPVLTNISFTANPGETTAIIGSTGSGKSTLINLIPRLYDVTAGQITIDGIDIREMSLDSLYRQIGYVPQKGVLFSGTIKSNIKYGDKDIDDFTVKRAGEISQSTEFIKSLERGFDSPIAQGGSNVSGGQKQRLSIARAIARKPKIYLFDDSFSALDFETDAKLRSALKKEIKDKTFIIIGQRIATIMDAENIIVLEEGKIVGQGTHNELMKNCSVYKEIAYSQLSEKEISGNKPVVQETKGAL